VRGELAAAAWLGPSVITKTESRFLEVELDCGPGYGDVLTWGEGGRPKKEIQQIEIHVDRDTAKFYKMFVDLLSAPAPQRAVR
jgi:hypothetical protein